MQPGRERMVKPKNEEEWMTPEDTQRQELRRESNEVVKQRDEPSKSERDRLHQLPDSDAE